MIIGICVILFKENKIGQKPYYSQDVYRLQFLYMGGIFLTLQPRCSHTDYTGFGDVRSMQSLSQHSPLPSHCNLLFSTQQQPRPY